VGLANWRFGSTAASGSQFFNGDIEQVAIWFNQRVSDADLQSMTV
jgi:hypothetical protein